MRRDSSSQSPGRGGAQEAPGFAAAGWALAAITALAAVLRFWRLGAASLWLDEAASWVISRHSALDLALHNVDHGNPPLYYVVLGSWMRRFGDSEAAMRSLSAVAGVIAVPAIYLLGRELWNRRIGLLAALLLAMSPWHVAHSREARQYAPVLLLGLLSTLLFARALRTDRWFDWLGAALCAALGFYVHYSGALIPLFEAGYLVLAGSRGRAWVALAVLSALCLPGALLYLAPSFLSAGGYTYWQGHATPEALMKLLNTAFGRPVARTSSLAAKVVGGAVMMGALGGAVGYVLWRARSEASSALRPMRFALCYALLPVGAFVLLSQWKPVWQDRYVFLALPGLVLVMAWTLSELRGVRRALLAAAIAVPTALGLATTIVPRGEGWRAVAGAVDKAERDMGTDSGVVIITPPFMSFLFGYYHRAGLPVVGFPEPEGPIGAMDIPSIDAAAAGDVAARLAGKAPVLVLYLPQQGPDPERRVAHRLAEERGPGRFTDLGEAELYAFGPELVSGR